MKLVSGLFILFTLCSCAQLSQQIDKFKTTESVKSESEKKYERRVEYVIDVNSSALNSYKKTNLWLAKKLNNSKNAIQVQDEKELLIASKM